MNYTVIWQPSAEKMLADLWTNAPDRDAVAASADHIDALLQRDPHGQGESRTGLMRLLIVPPLAVHYLVRDSDRTVLVLKVWRSR
jgi:ParE toxin of type II toxin-antitoxin system, parDE